MKRLTFAAAFAFGSITSAPAGHVPDLANVRRSDLSSGPVRSRRMKRGSTWPAHTRTGSQARTAVHVTTVDARRRNR